MAIEYVTLPATGAKVAVDVVDTDNNVQVVKLGWAADGTTPNLVDTASGKALPIQLRDSSGNELVSGQRVKVRGESRLIVAPFTTLTRPANTTAYAANDHIANNGTAGSVTAQSATVSDVNDDPILIRRLILDTTDTGLAAGTEVRAYLFNSDPTASSGVGGGDNAAWSQKRAGFIGSLSGVFRAFSDGGKGILVPDEGMEIIANPVSGAATLYFLLQALAAFTPSANSTTIIATLAGIQGRAS